MSGTQSTTGQILGASSAVVAGVAMLPETGGSMLGLVLPLVSIGCGTVILLSLLTTRVLKKVV